MSDLISKQRAIEAIDRFIPADPMMSDYTQGISVGLAIATRCIEEFSQENDDSSQGLVKDLIRRQDAKDAIDMALDHIDHVPPWVYDKLLNALNEVPSVEPETPSNGSITYINPENTHDRTTGDLISRKQAIDYIKTQRGRPFIGITLEEAIIMMIEEVPSAEPKTPSNGSITYINPENTHDRTTGDLISREDVLHELDGCDYELKDWQRWKLKTMVRDIPSAEKAQLSGEDATSVCKCPCEYREPCDVCHYDAYREHGCPAEEGMKDE